MGASRTNILAAGMNLAMRAAMPPETWNPADGTVEVVFSGAGWRTKRWRPEIGDFYEELGLEPHEINLRVLQEGGPVLNAHGRQDHAHNSTPGLEDQVATVVEAWTTGAEAIARIRMIDRPDLAWVRAGVAAGDFRKLSAGYTVERYVWTGDAEDGLPVYRAVDWTPFEISLLPIAEDATALVRSASNHTTTFEPTTRPQQMAKPKTKTQASTASKAPKAASGQGAQTPVEVQHAAGEIETRSAAVDQSAVETDPALVAPPTAAPAPIQAPAPAAGAPGVVQAAQPLETRAAAGAPSPSASDVADQTLNAERNRVAEITRIGAMSGIPEGVQLATRAIAEGSSVEQFRNAALERVLSSSLAERPENQHGATVGLEVGESSSAKRYRAIQDGLNYRCGAVAPADIDSDAKMFAGRTLTQLAEECLILRGVDVRNFARQELFNRAMSTGDFPLLLANTANKRVVGSYEAVSRTFTAWARRSVANDFKSRSAVRLGSGTAPTQIPETGEIPLGKLTEGGESYRLFEYGVRLAFTRQMLVNDDTNTLDKVPARLGARMAELEGDVVYALLTSNPTLSDGVAAFHANHGNLGAGSPNVAGFGTMRTAMRKQTDEDGSKINVTPRHIVVPPELETLAQQNTALLAPVAAGSVNPFQGLFETVQAEPRLTDVDDWYGFGDPALAESIEYAYLAGAETPQVELEDEFSTSGRQIRILHAFGAGWTDWRGAYLATN